MKRFLAIALTASFGLIAGSASAVTVGDYNAGDAANGIGQSRHNLGSLGVHIIADETSQICVFCHTPHHANTTTTPLWNRNIPNLSSYTAYGTTIANTTISNGDLGSSTLACLSCHDGTTTFDNLVNRPGKDLGGGDQNWTFTEDGGASTDYLTSGRLNIANVGTMGNVNADAGLSDDHPVSVPYTHGVASLRDSDTTISTIDISTDLGSTDANVMQNLWAVKGYFNSSATIGDLLRDNSNAGAMTVECASCHDPHFSNKTYDEQEWSWGGEGDSDGLFLRRVGANQGSGVCRTCHNK